MRFAPTLDAGSAPAADAAPAAVSQPPLTPAPPVTPAASFPALGRRPLPRWVGSAGLGLGQGALVLGLALFLALPLLAILIKSVTDGDGAWVGLSVMTGIIAGDGFLAMVGAAWPWAWSPRCWWCPPPTPSPTA